MAQEITSNVYGKLNLSTSEESVLIKRTDAEGNEVDLLFPVDEAAEIALQTIYSLLSHDKRESLEKCPFYSDVKEML